MQRHYTTDGSLVAFRLHAPSGLTTGASLRPLHELPVTDHVRLLLLELFCPAASFNESG